MKKINNFKDYLSFCAFIKNFDPEKPVITANIKFFPWIRHFDNMQV